MFCPFRVIPFLVFGFCIYVIAFLGRLGLHDAHDIVYFPERAVVSCQTLGA